MASVVRRSFGLSQANHTYVQMKIDFLVDKWEWGRLKWPINAMVSD